MTSALAVPSRPPVLDMTAIMSAAPVRSISWVDVAKLQNYILGRGANLIPCMFPSSVTIASGATATLAWRLRPRIQAVERIWTVRARTSTGVSNIDITIPSGGTAVTHTLTDVRASSTNFVFRERRSSQADAQETISMDIAPASQAVLIEQICCWEVPRFSLVADTTDFGVDSVRVRRGQPINSTSIANIVSCAVDEQEIGRRVGLISWACPYLIGGSASTLYAARVTAGSASAFQHGIPILARKDRIGDTTATVNWRVLAWTSAGASGGQVRLESSVNGNTSYQATMSGTTTPTWYGDWTATVDCEDLTADDGLQSSTYDEINLGLQVTSGTLYVAALTVWEQ